MKKKIISIILTGIIIAMIIISGGAKAFEMNLRISDSNIRQGQTIIITPTIQIESKDSNLPINYLMLVIENLNGNSKKVCKFDVNGNKLSNCDDVLGIRLIEISNQSYGYGYGTYLGAIRHYGYGYGYNHGNLTYEIILSTENLVEGTYSTLLQVKIQNDIFEKFGGNFIVSPKSIDEFIPRHSGSVNESRKIYEYNQKMIEIKEYQTYNFKYGNENHIIEVNDIDSNSVNMVVHSNPEHIILKDDKSFRVDLDGEIFEKNDLESSKYTTDDIEIKILYIGEKGKDAVISIKGLNDDVKIEKTNYIEETEIQSITKKEVKLNSVEENQIKKNINEILFWFGLFVILNLFLIGFIITLSRKK